MEIIHLSVDTPMQVHDSVCALGFFDGVHLGHQQLLKEVEHIAKEKGLKKAIMTFSVHPKQILENNDYHYLMSLSEKINILKQWQFDYFYIMKKCGPANSTEIISTYIYNTVSQSQVVIYFLYFQP